MKNHIIISLLFLLVGCSKTPTDLDTLNKRGDTYYKVNSEEPFSGSVINKYESGQNQMKGSLENGKDDGLVTIWYENGQMVIKGTYKDGKKDGLQIQWWDNGQKMYEGIDKDRKLDGLWTFWYENGQKLKEETYKDGELISKKEWNEDGSVKE